MDSIWYLTADLFRLIYTVVPFFGLWINKALIIVGFIAFIWWLNEMRKDQNVEKFD